MQVYNPYLLPVQEKLTREKRDELISLLHAENIIPDEMLKSYQNFVEQIKSIGEDKANIVDEHQMMFLNWLLQQLQTDSSAISVETWEEFLRAWNNSLALSQRIEFLSSQIPCISLEKPEQHDHTKIDFSKKRSPVEYSTVPALVEFYQDYQPTLNYDAAIAAIVENYSMVAVKEQIRKYLEHYIRNKLIQEHKEFSGDKYRSATATSSSDILTSSPRKNFFAPKPNLPTKEEIQELLLEKILPLVDKVEFQEEILQLQDLEFYEEETENFLWFGYVAAWMKRCEQTKKDTSLLNLFERLNDQDLEKLRSFIQKQLFNPGPNSKVKADVEAKSEVSKQPSPGSLAAYLADSDYNWDSADYASGRDFHKAIQELVTLCNLLRPHLDKYNELDLINDPNDYIYELSEAIDKFVTLAAKSNWDRSKLESDLDDLAFAIEEATS